MLYGFPLEISYGWHAALINSPEELKFIQKNQNELSDKEDFYIGGTTNVNSAIILSNFTDYLPNSSGKTEKD